MRSEQPRLSLLPELIDKTQTTLNAIRALHAELAQSTGHEPDREAALAQLLAARDATIPILGRAVLNAIAGGATLTVTPTTNNSPQSAPEATLDVEVAAPVEEALAEPESEPVSPVEIKPAIETEVSVPAPEPRSVPAQRPPPAPKASLLALSQRGIGAMTEDVTPLRPTFPDDLQRLMAALPIAPVRDESGARVATHALQALIDADAHWLDAPQPLQRSLLGLCSSMARYLQDEASTSLDIETSSALRGMFSRMTRYSSAERPGFVSGLSRRNSANSGSWLQDALSWRHDIQEQTGLPALPSAASPESALHDLELAISEGFENRKQLIALVKEAVAGGLSQSDTRLIQLLTPHQSLLKGARDLKTLKTALKVALAGMVDFETVQDKASPVPEDWPHFEATRGKRAVILGGDPRPEALERIRAAFGFGELEWEITDVRRSLAMAERVRSGSVDMVLLLIRFIHHRHHDAIKPACYDSGVPLVMVDSGYGVVAVRRAIQKALSAHRG